MNERRKIALLSDDPNIMLGVSRAQKSGNFDIDCIVCSTPKLSSAMKSFLVDVPFEKIITLCPNNSEKFTRQLLLEISSRGATDIGQHNYPYEISNELIKNFSGNIFRQTDVNPNLFPNLSGKPAYQAAIDFTRETGGIEDSVHSVIERVSLTEYGQRYWWSRYIIIKKDDTSTTLEQRCIQPKKDTATEFYSNITHLPNPSRITKREYLNGYELEILNECCPQPLLLRAVA